MISYLMQIFAASNACSSISSGGFFGFPKWYKYLDGTVDPKGRCVPAISNLNDVWLIVAAGIEILLRVAAIVAVAFVVYAGIQYATSQGSPDQVNKAKNSLINAVAGLAIAILAAAIVSFIAKRIAS